jgi:hypothetical protein
MMTAAELRASRRKLGEMWGKGRPLRCAELGRALMIKAKDPGETIRRYERGTRIHWSVECAVTMMLRGSLPPGGIPT